MTSRDLPSGSQHQCMKQAELHRLTATAYHEAGHAVMAVVLGRTVEKVTVCPAELQTGGGRLGACKIQKGRRGTSNDQVEDDLLVLLAGMAAERQFTEQYCRIGAAQDLMIARRLLRRRAGSERQLERLEKRLLDKTEHLLNGDTCRLAIRLIVQDLLAKETISGRAVKHHFDQAVRQVERQSTES